MSGLERQFIEEAFATNWLAPVGPNVTAFEHEFGERFGLSTVALSSGTAALHLGLRALGVGPGDRVFCSDLTFVASANPIVYLSAEPVFIDSEPQSWNMDPNVLAEALAHSAQRNALPKAVIVVHLFGQSADMDPILEVCQRYGVPILEDAAEALGAVYKNHPVGTMGNVAAFSFNGNKVITTTGGGMLGSRDPALIDRARNWAAQAREPGQAYEHAQLGYNYGMSNVLAGIGRGQLLVLAQRVEQRRALAARYAAAFRKLPGIQPMPEAPYGLHTRWLSCFLIDEAKFGCSRDQLIAHLDRANIEARPAWKPMHLQRLYSQAQTWGGRVAEDIFARGICLPSSSSLTEDEQNYVIENVTRSCGRLVNARGI